MVYFCYTSSSNVCVAYIFFVLNSHLATLWESNCPFGFLLVMFPLGSSYFVFVFLSLWCLWWEVWDNCIDPWSLPSFLFRCLHEETLQLWLSKVHPGKILIRLRAGWSESSLGAHVQRYIFRRYGSNDLNWRGHGCEGYNVEIITRTGASHYCFKTRVYKYVYMLKRESY